MAVLWENVCTIFKRKTDNELWLWSRGEASSHDILKQSELLWQQRVVFLPDKRLTSAKPTFLETAENHEENLISFIFSSTSNTHTPCSDEAEKECLIHYAWSTGAQQDIWKKARGHLFFYVCPTCLSILKCKTISSYSSNKMGRWNKWSTKGSRIFPECPHKLINMQTALWTSVLLIFELHISCFLLTCMTFWKKHKINCVAIKHPCYLWRWIITTVLYPLQYLHILQKNCCCLFFLMDPFSRQINIFNKILVVLFGLLCQGHEEVTLFKVAL